MIYSSAITVLFLAHWRSLAMDSPITIDDLRKAKVEGTRRLGRLLVPGLSTRALTADEFEASAEDAEKVLVDDKDVDGYLVYIMAIWNHGNLPIASSGKPTLLVLQGPQPERFPLEIDGDQIIMSGKPVNISENKLCN